MSLWSSKCSTVMLQQFLVVWVVMVAMWGSASYSKCDFEAIFNFGDSNSDTGGFWAAFPAQSGPFGMTYFKRPAGRASDGRLMVDFLGNLSSIIFRPCLFYLILSSISWKDNLNINHMVDKQYPMYGCRLGLVWLIVSNNLKSELIHFEMKKNKLEEGLFLSRNPAAQRFFFLFSFEGAFKFKATVACAELEF